MPRMTSLEYQAYLARRQKPAAQTETVAQARIEIGKGGLQEQIIKWCDAQWPRWVCDFPRTDQPSTLPLGRHDATVWGPYPQCYLIETKAKGKKRTKDQLIWAKRMEALGWKVEVIYSLEEFCKLVRETIEPKTYNP